MTAADAHDLQGHAWPLVIPTRPLSFGRLDSIRFTVGYGIEDERSDERRRGRGVALAS